RFPEKLVSPVFLETQESPLDGSQARLGEVSVLGCETLGVFSGKSDKGLEVFQIQEEPAIVVGQTEEDGQNRLLGLVGLEQTGKEEGTHLRRRCPDRMTFLPVDVPEGDG